MENVASAETRLALAAALDVPVADLMPPSMNVSVANPRRPHFVADRGFEAVMRNTLLGLGVCIAFLFALIILFNALSGFLPRG